MINKESGQILILVFVALGVVLFTVLFVIAGSQVYYQNSQYSYNAESALTIAEAGADKALASLNATAGSFNPNPDDEVTLGEGTFSIKITPKSATTKIIEATGFIPNKANPKAKRVVKVEASKGIGFSFNYGIQVGEGGLDIAKDSTINGSVYSNGNITMAQNTKITGDAWVAGGTAPVADQQSDCTLGGICQDYIFGKTVSGQNRQDVAQSFKSAQTKVINKVSLRLKKTGSPSNPTVRILSNSGSIPNKSPVLTSGVLSADTVTTQYGFAEVGLSPAYTLNANTTYWIMIHANSLDNSNYWYWQNDQSKLYGDGEPKWSSNWQAASPVWTAINPGDLDFKTYMGGVATSITGASGVTIQGDAHANTLNTLTISKGAYYQTSSSITADSYYPGSADPPVQTFPISQANIDDWKTQATTLPNQTYTGDISTCQTTLAAGKYVGSITIPASCTTTVGSPIWVTQDLHLLQGATIKLDPNFGAASGTFMVDNFISFDKDDSILGTGTAGSYLLLISNFNSKDDPQARVAIDVAKEGNNGILYSNLGSIHIAKENHLTSVTGWKLSIDKEMQINYDQGLAGTFFSSGPSGSYSLIKGTYQVK